MSHDACYLLAPADFIERSRPHRIRDWERLLGRADHCVPLSMVPRLQVAWCTAAERLFPGARCARAQRAIGWLLEGQRALDWRLQDRISGSMLMHIEGPALPEALEVLRALRPSRVPELDPALAFHTSQLRALGTRCHREGARWLVQIRG